MQIRTLCILHLNERTHNPGREWRRVWRVGSHFTLEAPRASRSEGSVSSACRDAVQQVRRDGIRLRHLEGQRGRLESKHDFFGRGRFTLPDYHMLQTGGPLPPHPAPLRFTSMFRLMDRACRTCASLRSEGLGACTCTQMLAGPPAFILGRVGGWWTGGVSLETPGLIKSSREETTHMYPWTPHQTGLKREIYPPQLRRETQQTGLKRTWMNPAVCLLCNRPPGLLSPQPRPRAPMMRSLRGQLSRKLKLLKDALRVLYWLALLTVYKVNTRSKILLSLACDRSPQLLKEHCELD